MIIPGWEQGKAWDHIPALASLTGPQDCRRPDGVRPAIPMKGESPGWA